MSITISPVGNFEHCEKLDLVKINREDCLCYGEHRENCHYCNGSGFFEEKIYPYELNISNGNFETLWNALGLEFAYCGEICPHILLEAVANADVQLIIRANYVDASENGATFYSFGIDAGRAESYLNRLSQIIIQAIARKVKIQWA